MCLLGIVSETKRDTSSKFIKKYCQKNHQKKIRIRKKTRKKIFQKKIIKNDGQKYKKKIVGTSRD